MLFINPNLIHISKNLEFCQVLLRFKAYCSTVVIASSREDEYCYTGQPYSAFTVCLLEALQGKAAVNKDGYARILDVMIYLLDQVPKRALGSQHPFVNKVLDLGDNFPLCYYAGGSKFLPGEALTPEVIPTTTGLTAGQKRRLEQKRDTLQAEWDIRSEKLKRMQADLAIEAGTAVKFQLEKQLLYEEARLARLGDELDEIEEVLQEIMYKKELISSVRHLQRRREEVQKQYDLREREDTTLAG